MGILTLIALVILQSILISSADHKTFLLHVRWLPTHCYHRECQVEDDEKWDISKLRVLPQLHWSSDECSYHHRFWRYDLSTITELSKYWSNPLDDFTHYFRLYKDYAACTAVDSNGPTPFLYFNRGIELFKILSQKAIPIAEDEIYSTEEFESGLKSIFSAQPKVICAENEANETFLHEIVFCFNENSALIDCPAEYSNDFRVYLQTRGESDFREQIDRQKLCGDSFIVPPHVRPIIPKEGPEMHHHHEEDSYSSNVFEDLFNWIFGY